MSSEVGFWVDYIANILLFGEIIFIAVAEAGGSRSNFGGYAVKYL